MWNRIVGIVLACICLLVVLALGFVAVRSWGQEYNVPFSVRDGYANVLASQHFNVNGTDCMTGEDETDTNVMPAFDSTNADCNKESAPAPNEGAQAAFLPAGTSGDAEFMYYDNAWSDGDVTGTPLVLEWDMNFYSRATDSGIIAPRLTDLGEGNYPWVQLYCSGINCAIKLLRLRCDGATQETTGGGAWAHDTWYEFKLIWYDTGGAEGCTGVSSCDDCGCLLKDGAEILSCDGSGVTVNDGVDFVVNGNTHDIAIDRWAVCNELPPDDTRCGDGVFGFVD